MSQQQLIPAKSGPTEWQEMKDQAQILLRSGFLPKAIDTPEKAVAIIMNGKEIGMPPMQALRQISVIQGKPVTSPEGQLCLIYKNCPGAVVNFKKLTNEVCEIHAKRPGGEFQIFTFSWEDAKRANLSTKQNWMQYPRAMLRSRCVGEMARSLFPDAIQGISYNAEELGAEVTVSDSGEMVIDTTPASFKAAQTIPNQPSLQQQGLSYVVGPPAVTNLNIAIPETSPISTHKAIDAVLEQTEHTPIFEPESNSQSEDFRQQEQFKNVFININDLKRLFAAGRDAKWSEFYIRDFCHKFFKIDTLKKMRLSDLEFMIETGYQTTPEKAYLEFSMEFPKEPVAARKPISSKLTDLNQGV